MSEKKINFYKKLQNYSNKIQNLLLKANLSFKVAALWSHQSNYSIRQTPSDSVIGRWEFHQFFDIKISKSLVIHRGSQKIEIQPNCSIANRRNNNNKGGNLLINFQKLLIRPIWMYDYMVKRHQQPFYVYHITGNVYRFSYWNRKLLDWIIWINYASSD